MVFSNLDLRLDVLERELGLPFTFVSGHIHELHIAVPWTRLNTEPIVITINTIECVLRLPDSGNSGASPDGSETSSVRSWSERKKQRRLQQQDDTNGPPPGYVQSLINKIISNVRIVCNNLILKYVEDDIVLSLNTRWLSLMPANVRWEASFVENPLADLVIRKLLQVKDMTVCLDKRDASGRIDTYQEPFLYRCSMTAHAAWIYSSSNSKVPLVTRYDIRCVQMDFSLSDTQLPMFLRIVKLVLALYYGQLTEKAPSSNPPKAQDCVLDMSAMSMEESAQSHSQGWSGWAWDIGSNIGTALLPIYWEDEEDADDESNPTGQAFSAFRDKELNIGLYVDQATFVFKLSDKGVNRKAFVPLLKMQCSGAYLETRALGVHTVHVSGGITALSLSPSGDCTCGLRDTLQSSESEAAGSEQEQEGCYLEAGQAQKKLFLQGSLFEKDFGDEEGNCQERRTPHSILWDDHLERVTEDTMLERAPAIALDLLYHLEVPEEADWEQLSAISDLESSDMDEKSLCRLVVGPCQARVCSGAQHRLNCVLQHLGKYDYPAYAKEPVEPPQIADQAESALVSAKRRVYQLTIINPTLSIYAADHPDANKSQISPRRVKSFLERLSCVISLDCLDSKVVMPMYLPRPGSPVTDICYANVSVKLMQLTSRLMQGSQGVTWLQPSSFYFRGSKLLIPIQGDNVSTSQWSLGLEMDAVKLRMSRPQWNLLVEHVLASWRSTSSKEPDGCVLQDAMRRKLPSIVTNVQRLNLILQSTGSLITAQCQCLDFTMGLGNVATGTIPLLSVDRPKPVAGTVAPVSPGRALRPQTDILRPPPEQKSWLRADLQWPVSAALAAEKGRHLLPLLSVQTGEVHVNFDPKLVDHWIGYQASPMPSAQQVKLDTRKSRSKSTCSLATLSLDQKKVAAVCKDDKSLPDAAKDLLLEWFEVLNGLLVQVQIEPVQLYAPRKSLAFCLGKQPPRRVAEAMAQVSYVSLCLPTVTLENVAHKPNIQQFLTSMPFSLPEGLWSTQRDNLPWTLKLTKFAVSSGLGMMLEPISTNCTLGLAAKDKGVGLCIHADMSPLKAQVTHDQLQQVVAVLERILHLQSPGRRQQQQQKTRMMTPVVDSSTSEPRHVVKMRGQSSVSNFSYDQSSQKRPSLSEDDHIKLGSEGRLEGQVSVWVQWTLPSASLSLLTSGKQKLQFSLEDYQSSFDWNPVYFQAKLRVLSATIRHLVVSGQDWSNGPNHGIILTFGRGISGDLETVHGNRVELLSTERAPYLNQTCFALIFTRAECEHLHAKWREASGGLRLDQNEELTPARFLSEIDVKVAPMDVVVDMEVLLPFTKLLARLVNIDWPSSQPEPLLSPQPPMLISVR